MKIAIDLVTPAMAAPRRRGLRQWQKYLLALLPVYLAGAGLLYVVTGGLFAPLLALLIWLLATAVILFFVWRAGRWQ